MTISHLHPGMRWWHAKSNHSQINKLVRLQSKLQQMDVKSRPGYIWNIAKEMGEGLITIQIYASWNFFEIAPTRITAKEIVTVTEVACQRLDGESADLLCNEVVGIMQMSKPPKSNRTKAERDALKTPKSNNDIVILPADRGKAVVAMDSNEYMTQCEKCLCDQATHRQGYQQSYQDPEKQDIV